ncbi:MAG TPA: hypothetical protein VKJ07_13335, partial [Mycobacteriales bacterium]|nr:hypothetical protein [Mycobacteriales bacterium]
ETPPSSNTQLAQSNADANQSGALNANVRVNVGQAGDTGNVTQANQAASAASSSATGSLATSGSGPSATARADTTETAPSNTNVAVLVGSSGDVGNVNQQNRANAGAAAVGSTAADGTGGGQATANATQTSPSNINVVVRVGSPGNNGDVTQANSVAATAGPTLGSNPSIDATTVAGAPATTDQTVTTSGQSSLSNTGNVDQELLQTMDGDGPDLVTDVTPDDAVPTASTGTATATQRGAQNLNVSIRIGSSGTDGTVRQGNSATATGTSPDLGVIDSSDGTNENITIVLPGSAAGAPGADWAWNWNWTGDGTPPADATAASAAPTTGSTWNWSWTPTPPPNQTSNVSAAGSSITGMFTWTWNWVLPDGTLRTLTEQTACTCNWQWTWNWDWSGGPPKTANAATPSVDPSSDNGAPADSSSTDAPTLSLDTGTVDQSNTVTASAEASAQVWVTNLLAVGQSGVDPSLGMQEAQQGRTFENTQLPSAAAEAE